MTDVHNSTVVTTPRTSIVSWVTLLVALLAVGFGYMAWLNTTKPQPAPVVQIQQPASPVDEYALERAAIERAITAYGWDAAAKADILTSFDARAFERRSITIDPNGNGNWWNNGYWGSPYGKRWSENNFTSHLRDEYPAGAEVWLIAGQNARYSILFDGCGNVEKTAVGVKPKPPTPVVHKPRKPKPNREVGELPLIVCSSACP